MPALPQAHRRAVKCTVCGQAVKDGLLEGGRARHAACGVERKHRQCLSLPTSAIETFKRLGKGNISEGGRIAANLADEAGA